MNGTKKTEYTFEVNSKVKVTVDGRDTEENYHKAMLEAIEQAKKEVDINWLDDVNAEEFTDYEDEYKEAV